jgi:hypothetical protein
MTANAGIGREPMRARWVKIAGMGVMLLAFGCRTPKPDLKPATTAEALNTPPAERRFDTPAYPKEAFNNRDPLKKLNPDQDITPVRGPGGMPGTPGSIGAYH